MPGECWLTQRLVKAAQYLLASSHGAGMESPDKLKPSRQYALKFLARNPDRTAQPYRLNPAHLGEAVHGPVRETPCLRHFSKRAQFFYGLVFHCFRSLASDFH